MSVKAPSYVLAPSPVPAVPVRGTDRLFPVHRIYCVGRNYAEHAKEMGGDPTREPPFFFQKNPDTLVPDGGSFPYPSRSKDVHHEFELVVAIGKGGQDIAPEQALAHVFGYAVGLDMTRRDLQGEAKKAGRPWEVGKAFEHAAPCSAIAPVAAVGHPAKGAVWLEVNGEPRQKGDLADLIWSVPEVIAHLSGLFRLVPGDLIYTGTPGQTRKMKPGDVVEVEIEGIGILKNTVAAV